MSISIDNHVVVFDYGQVISLPPAQSEKDALVAASGTEPDLFWEAYWRHRRELDHGTLTPDTYWQVIADETGSSWSPTLRHTLWSLDFRSWLTLNPDTVTIVQALHEGNTPLALLSNAGADFGSFFRHGSLGSLFHRVFVSGELGLTKPDPAIFTHVLNELGVSADQAIFVDDIEANVQSAERLGINGHVFTSADALRAYLGSFSS